MAETTPDQSEIDHLRRWKSEAASLLIAWDRVWVTLGRPGELGESKAKSSEAEVERLRDELAEAKRQLAELGIVWARASRPMTHLAPPMPSGRQPRHGS